MPGEQRSWTSAFLFPRDDLLEEILTSMFVVMRTGATEAEVNGVKGLILAEGLTPFENAGGTTSSSRSWARSAARRPQLMARLETMPGVAA